MAERSLPTPELIDVDQVADGWIKKYVLTYRLPDGRDYRYESVSRKGRDAYVEELRGLSANPPHAQTPDAVCIVPRTPDNRLVLIKEFRYPVNSWCIAFPAGLIDPGETYEQAVERELREETGYGLHRDAEGKAHVRPLSQPSLSSAGMSEESIQVVYVHVENEPTLGAAPESTEYIQVFTVPVDDVPEFLTHNATPISTRAQLILETFARNVERYGRKTQ
jgi:ADP-ribose pyrophosphatase